MTALMTVTVTVRMMTTRWMLSSLTFAVYACGTDSHVCIRY